MASSQVILRGDGFLPPPSAVSSIPSPRGFLYAWTSPHTTHCTRRTSSSYMLMMVCVVSALHRGDGQYASISPPTSSASSSKMESINSPLLRANYWELRVIQPSGLSATTQYASSTIENRLATMRTYNRCGTWQDLDPCVVCCW